ncbi:MAG: hypothetical protein GY755_10720, partial [Chloroflexi bacterium]|nr:hypothetical protein [Chloroflexota bacterium]
MAIYGAELPEGAILDEPQEPQGKIYGAELPEGFTLDPVVDAYQNGTLNGRKKQAFEELQRRGQIDINQFLQDVPKTAEQPVSERPFGVAAMTPEQAPMGDMGQPIQPPQEPRQALGTLQRIGEVYPVLETAAEMVTSTYGIPVSGLAGLVALPFGLETSEDVMEKVQKALVYKPQTAGGQELARAAQYPMEKLEGVAAMAGKALEEEG